MSDLSLLMHEKAQQEWRDPAGVASWWEAPQIAGELLIGKASDGWSDLLLELGITLVISREYENFLVALSASAAGGCRQTHLPLPHPSGMAYDPARATLHVACTRNPNQILQLRPAADAWSRQQQPAPTPEPVLMPTQTNFLPGCAYLHDLVWHDESLWGNAVGMNAVVRIEDNQVEPRWWPRAIETDGVPDWTQNHLQLNAIALRDGFERAAFTASTARIGARKPGQRHFAVDRRGVVFDAATREVAATGLTRPHSARFHGETLLVNDSGYGRLVAVDLTGDRLVEIARLPGWTRGLALIGDVAFVGVSRVLLRFAHYAPGLDAASCRCGIVAVDLRSGKRLGSYYWPHGNQIFAIEALPATVTCGLPMTRRPTPARLKTFFSTASTTICSNPRNNP